MLRSPGMPSAPNEVIDYAARHLVIGAGFAGLGVAAALGRAGIAFDVVEAADDVGGNWYHGVYDSVHIISSRKTTEYAEWPMPATWPDFPSGAQMLSYLRGYADQFDVRRHIEFNTRAVKVSPAGDRWRVELRHADGRQDEVRIYGGVVVCNGHHWDKRMPAYPGAFAGPLLHAKGYKSSELLRGQRVLVIGGGNSACDIAVAAARVGAAAHLSLRRGYWFLPKTVFGRPLVEALPHWLPERAQRLVVKALARVFVGSYEAYGLPRPDHEPFAHHPTINSELLYELKNGRIAPHGDVARFDGLRVEFVDGTSIEVDLVICATGYHVSFPCVDAEVIPFEGGMPDLIAGMLPRHHRNLYVFGLGQPRYGAGPLISAGAALLAEMIAVQPGLQRPLGQIMARLGVKPPRSYLANPHKSLRQARLGRRLMRHLPTLERRLFSGVGEGARSS
ncbi:MAG: NAD(P)-binding domain-containing protein [Myxococcales bacterium]|nr:NAD(P)-binding domain-containing protein [Myxococcales bacterium]